MATTRSTPSGKASPSTGTDTVGDKASDSKADAIPPEACVLVLQGGGALGAYQGGVFEALCERCREPAWVAGISIGAINAALIAGNPPEMRVRRLREFWELVSSSTPAMLPDFLSHLRPSFNDAVATQVLLFGVPGFFVPRVPPPALQPRGTPQAVSYYDTVPLRRTLERLVDFDRINDGPIRLSVGAVNVRTGNFQYFDTRRERLDARHIMASGALPPGFPAVEIDGEAYWDGGIVSNTPLDYVLSEPGDGRRVVFQVDLFSAHGPMPTTLNEVSEREKDIRFSSRTRLTTNIAVERQAKALAAKRLTAKLPAELRHDPDLLALTAVPCEAPLDVVHLIYRSKHYETLSKDFEFSRQTMNEHWDSGRADMAHTLHHPRWIAQDRNAPGIHVFDLTGDSPIAT